MKHGQFSVGHDMLKCICKQGFIEENSGVILPKKTVELCEVCRVFVVIYFLPIPPALPRPRWNVFALKKEICIFTVLQ